MVEFRCRAPRYGNHRLLSVYFGGGTPTTFGDDLFAEIIAQIADECGTPTECTLEANPEHVT
ncbi:MAG: hypothetical protein KIG72_05615, partial [Bradymonadales bacterium]|nr:hypothetical protein [Bradymonadales bacterium]